MTIPNLIRLFHITPIANLSDICDSGALLSKNTGASAGIAYQNIAHSGAQRTRSGKNVPNPPGGVVHDYVPFYFAPRSPMLFAINGGRVSGCNWRQQDILHFETTVEKVTKDGKKFVFYDLNATLAFSTPYTNVVHLDKVAWDLITETPRLDGFCKYWQNRISVQRYRNRMECRQAEFLVKSAVGLNEFLRIGAINDQKADEVRTILNNKGVNLAVEVIPDWYFLPGQ